jgi:hypothetical protein
VRLLPTSREILRTLNICPWIPVDVLAALISARSRVSVYQALARLAAAGLIERRQVRLGPLAGARPISLWAVTSLAQDISGTADSDAPDIFGRDDPLSFGSRHGRSRRNIADPLRIAGARALAAWLAGQSARGHSVRLAAWGSPWIGQGVAGTTVRFPAAAIVESTVTTGEHRQLIVVLPDLGTSPIIRFRTAIRRLGESLTQSDSQDPRCALRLVVVTTNIDGHAARQKAWIQLIERLQTRTGLSQLPTSILEWPEVYRLLGLARPAGSRRDAERESWRRPTGRRLGADEVLDLVGRHPFLTIEQVAALLAITQGRARELRQSLVAQGLVRRIPLDELVRCLATRSDRHRSSVADVAELTTAGRRRVADHLGLPAAAARRHQGLLGGSSGHRLRALRHLAHTMGVNQVFVQLAVAARSAKARGADEALEEWRPAAACERRHCKPDGYGCYRRGDAWFGFFLEYDRGTERASQYDAKLAAYYAYRNSGQAARDYAGLPYLLFVTTTSAAEARILAAVSRAYHRFGEPPLPVRVTTMDRIAAASADVLGSTWTRSQPEPRPC